MAGSTSVLSFPVVGSAGPDTACAIDLLERDDEREFVLEGKGAEGPEKIGFCTHGVAPSVGGPYEDGTLRDGAVLQSLEFRGKGFARELTSAFIKEDSETTFRLGQHPVMEVGGGFEKVGFDAGDGFEAREVVSDAGFCVGQGGASRDDDAPDQRGTGLKSAAW